MSTSTQQGLNFRPRSYFVSNLDTAVLSRIKGKARRAAVRRLGPTQVDTAMAAESLSEDERQAVGCVHPSFMGGEYLPDLDTLEVEIARFELESVTADVISLRARRADGRIHYRLVDEYDTAYLITPASSDTPLTFGELVELINSVQFGGDPQKVSLPRSLREWNFENDGGQAEQLEHFVRVSSEFYPQLAGYYGAEAAAWVAEKLTERGTQCYYDEEFATARECFEKAADLGHAPAEASLAYFFFHGLDVPQDYATARQWWEKAAAQGYAKAQYNLAALYAGGHGVPQDDAQARQWYEKAAGQGYAEAQSHLGFLYASGEGGPQDYEQARVLWEQAASQGDTDAQLNLGKMYVGGIGVRQDFLKARFWWKRASAQGDVEAQACLRWLNDMRIGYDN